MHGSGTLLQKRRSKQIHLVDQLGSFSRGVQLIVWSRVDTLRLDTLRLELVYVYNWLAIRWSWSVVGVCMAFSWRLPDVCLTFPWRLPDVCPTFSWCLPLHSSLVDVYHKFTFAIGRRLHWSWALVRLWHSRLMFGRFVSLDKLPWSSTNSCEKWLDVRLARAYGGIVFSHTHCVLFSAHGELMEKLCVLDILKMWHLSS